MPTAVTSGANRKIYKRVGAKQVLDKTYKDVLAELDSQTFAPRKRARKCTYARPYPGHVDFHAEDKEQNSGTQDLALARGKAPYSKNILTSSLSDTSIQRRSALPITISGETIGTY